MFVAVIIGGNEQIYPIAFGFDNGKNNQSWSCFLTELRIVIGSPIFDDYFRSSYKH